MPSVDTRGLKALVEGWAADVVEEAAQTLADEVHEEVPVGEDDPLGRRHGGTLRDSQWGPKQVGPREWEFGYTAEHGRYVDEGTAAHWIVGSPLLVFWWDVTERTMYLPAVWHPGYQPDWRWWSDVVTASNWLAHLQFAAD